jgi:hypothetical protein
VSAFIKNLEEKALEKDINYEGIDLYLGFKSFSEQNGY